MVKAEAEEEKSNKLPNTKESPSIRRVAGKTFRDALMRRAATESRRSRRDERVLITERKLPRRGNFRAGPKSFPGQAPPHTSETF